MDITITGTRDISRDAAYYEELFEWFLAPFAEDGHAFWVGGAVGIDTVALGWLTVRQAPVTVVVPATVEDQPATASSLIRRVHDAKLAELVELKHPSPPQADAYHARNRYMVDRSEFVIGFPKRGEQSGGTWYTLGYAAAKELPRLIIPVS